MCLHSLAFRKLEKEKPEHVPRYRKFLWPSVQSHSCVVKEMGPDHRKFGDTSLIFQAISEDTLPTAHGVTANSIYIYGNGCVGHSGS